MTKDFSSCDMPSDDDLIQAIRRKNEVAFSYLYDMYAASIFGIIKHKVQCPSDAEDIFQKIFQKIWSNASLYNHKKERIFTWMLHIANSETISYFHSQNEKDTAVSSSLIHTLPKPL